MFLAQFGVACACLTSNVDRQRVLIENIWRFSDDSSKIYIMKMLKCCAFENFELSSNDTMGYPPCKLAQVSFVIIEFAFRYLVLLFEWDNCNFLNVELSYNSELTGFFMVDSKEFKLKLELHVCLLLSY